MFGEREAIGLGEEREKEVGRGGGGKRKRVMSVFLPYPIFLNFEFVQEREAN